MGITASIATLGNIGPGFDAIGPMASYAPLHVSSKAVLIVAMWLGRLELSPLPMKASTRYWSSYLLDLMPIEVMACALSEFLRVLKPSGRAVLVNLTKLETDRMTWYERCYRAMPTIGQAYIFGGCRPVRLSRLVGAAGFIAVNRAVVPHALSSEIIVARKTSARTAGR